MDYPAATPPPFNPFGTAAEPAPAAPQPAPADAESVATVEPAELPALTLNGVPVPARSTTDDTPEPQEPTR